METWLLYALLAAACAGAIYVLAKVGMKGIDSDLATAVRSIVQAAFVVGFCAFLGLWNQLDTMRGRALVMVILSGVAGGLSWIFVFRALRLADVSRVAPIDKLSLPMGVLLAVLLLGERPTPLNWAGIALVLFGAWLAAIPGRA